MKIHAIILAGGKGSRLSGKDKALEIYQGKRLIDWTLDAIKDSVDSICISSNRNTKQYSELGYALYPDDPDPASFLGPISGIISCTKELEFKANDYVLIVPCDTPLLQTNFVERLKSRLDEKQICVAHDGQRLHNLHCLMSASYLEILENYFNGGGRSMKFWLSQQDIAHCDFSDSPEQFKNFNSSSDFSDQSQN
jgi:molybdopterin-guanine dinucleotide biosynthesis protein A